MSSHKSNYTIDTMTQLSKEVDFHAFTFNQSEAFFTLPSGAPYLIRALSGCPVSHCKTSRKIIDRYETETPPE